MTIAEIRILVLQQRDEIIDERNRCLEKIKAAAQSDNEFSFSYWDSRKSGLEFSLGKLDEILHEVNQALKYCDS